MLQDNVPSASERGDPVDRIVINVGGVKFETHIATLQNIVDTRLAWLTENADPDTFKGDDFFFDRHPGAFIYILNFYRTGKLHTPKDMCGPAFEEELQFWGIDEKQMEPCCWESFTKHREAEANLRSFEGPGFEDLHSIKNRKASAMSHSNQRYNRFLNKLWKILDDPHSSKCAKMFSLLSCFMIILSVSGYCLSTMPSMHSHKKLMLEINYICVVFFTIECVARLATTPNRKAFLMDYKNWIDFISVAPSYLVLVVTNNWVKNLVIIRLLRVFKFFKLSYGLQVMLHTLKASSYELILLLLILLIPLVIFSSLVYAVESNFPLDKNQEPTKFTSIPVTFWWCLITMTTVGYGDITPLTWPGQIIGSVCAIFGLLIIALPISVIGGNFSLYYAHVRARLKLPRKNRKLLQGNMRGLLRHPLSLSLRDRDRKLKRNNQKAIRLKPERTSPSPLRDYSMREDDAISNHSNSSRDTAQLLEEHAKLEGMPRPRTLRRTALIQMSSSNESINSNTSTNTVEKETQTHNSNLEGNDKSIDSLYQLNNSPNNENEGNDHTRQDERNDRDTVDEGDDHEIDSGNSSNYNRSNEELVIDSNENLLSNDILRPVPINNTPSQNSLWSNCSSPPEYNNHASDSDNCLGSPAVPGGIRDFHDITRVNNNEETTDVNHDDSSDNEENSDEDSTLNLTRNPPMEESNIDDNLSRIELELNKNSERILLENLKKLTSISKSLDEKVSSYHSDDKTKDPAADTKRRISMKLLTNCDQLMMGGSLGGPLSSPKTENGYFNDNSINAKNKYHLKNALAPNVLMNFHSPRKKYAKSPESIFEEINQSDGSDGHEIEPSKNGRLDNGNKHGSERTASDNEINDLSINNRLSNDILNNNKKIFLPPGIYDENNIGINIDGIVANNDPPSSLLNMNSNNLLSPNRVSHNTLIERVKSESDLTICDVTSNKREHLARNKSEMNILRKSVKESGV